MLIYFVSPVPPLVLWNMFLTDCNDVRSVSVVLLRCPLSSLEFLGLFAANVCALHSVWFMDLPVCSISDFPLLSGCLSRVASISLSNG